MGKKDKSSKVRKIKRLKGKSNYKKIRASVKEPILLVPNSKKGGSKKKKDKSSKVRKLKKLAEKK